METRIALIGIIVENKEAAAQINAVLHDFDEYVRGRMGLPCPEQGIRVISVVVDAPADKISALSGKLGMLPGVTTKTVYSRAQNA